jgi:transposase
MTHQPVSQAHDDTTRDYIVRRTAEGKTMGEIARMLKRYIAREIY